MEKQKDLHEIVAKSLQKYQIKAYVIDCDPELADTAAFCEHYGYSLEESANTIIVASRKVEPPKYAACLVLANTKLDVNKVVTKLLGVKKASFADAETTKKLTGMVIGGVTITGIENTPLFIDARVMVQEKIIIGGGNRSTKLILAPSELLKLPGLIVIENLAFAL